MTAAELSAELARALGYFPECVRIVTAGKFDSWPTHCEVYREYVEGHPRTLCGWMSFHYTDPTVYGPLVAWLVRNGGVMLCGLDNDGVGLVYKGWKTLEADTLPEAVARACIAVRSGR